MQRSETVAAFIAIAGALFQSEKLPGGGRRLAARLFERLRTPSDDGVRHRTRYPANDWLDTALAPLTGDDTLFSAAARALKALEPDLGWSRRSSGENGSENYVDAHVQGMVCGPGGAESR